MVHHHRHVMDQHVMDHHLDLHRRVEHQDDHRRRRHRPVHLDHVVNTTSNDYFSFSHDFSKRQTIEHIHLFLRYLFSFSNIEPNGLSCLFFVFPLFHVYLPMCK